MRDTVGVRGRDLVEAYDLDTSIVPLAETTSVGRPEASMVSKQPALEPRFARSS